MIIAFTENNITGNSKIALIYLRKMVIMSEVPMGSRDDVLAGGGTGGTNKFANGLSDSG